MLSRRHEPRFTDLIATGDGEQNIQIVKHFEGAEQKISCSLVHLVGYAMPGMRPPSEFREGNRQADVFQEFAEELIATLTMRCVHCLVVSADS
eukprot:3711054-Amphidinium_carterae.1